MESIFSGNSYASPPSTGLPLRHYLFLGSRWGMHFSFIKDIIFKYRREALDGIYDDQRWIDSSQHTLRILEAYGARVSITGMDNLTRGDGPYVFVANHMSTLETTVIPGIIRPHMPVTFVVKEKLTRGPVFSPIMRSREPIAVGRVNPREDLTKVLTEGVEKLQKGMSVVIFPQSTRTPQFIPERFNTLGIKLAQRADVKVIPIALKTDFWGEGGLFRGFGPVRRKLPVHFEFGAPISIEGKGKKAHQQIIEFIQSKLDMWAIEDAQQES